MFIWIVPAVAFVVLIFLLLGYPRLRLPRQASIEGIKNPEAAKGYDRISRNPQFKFLRRMIARELKRYHPQGIMVDAGCGPGYLVALIAKSFPHLQVIGIDIAQEMVEAATRNISSLSLKERVRFQQGDIKKLPFEDNAVDFMVSTLSLHHWSNPKEALHEIHRALKPGGQFLVFDLRRDCRRFFYWLLRFGQAFIMPASLRDIKEPTGSILSSYTPAEAEALLSGIPFQKWRIKPGVAWMFIWGRKG
jgi:ubiquinone/menaquinone biosynthesis C-methylase UbiE